MGDINIDSLTTNTGNLKLESLLATHNLRRLPLPATRVTPTSSTSIDCVCTNLPLSEIHATVIETCISDHKAQLTTINTPTTTTQSHTSLGRILSEKNLNNLHQVLLNHNWDPILTETNVDTAYNMFIQFIMEAMNITCPIKKTKAKDKKQHL